MNEPAESPRGTFPFDVLVFMVAVALLGYALSAAPEVDCDAESGPGPSAAYQLARAVGGIGFIAAAIIALLLPRSPVARVACAAGYLVVGGVMFLGLVANDMANGLC